MLNILPVLINMSIEIQRVRLAMVNVSKNQVMEFGNSNPMHSVWA